MVDDVDRLLASFPGAAATFPTSSAVFVLLAVDAVRREAEEVFAVNVAASGDLALFGSSATFRADDGFIIAVMDGVTGIDGDAFICIEFQNPPLIMSKEEEEEEEEANVRDLVAH